MPLEPDTRLGPYAIVSELGAGGMGEVYRAHDTRLGREVAVKVLAPHLMNRADALERFEREAKVVAALSQARPLRGRTRPRRYPAMPHHPAVRRTPP